MRSRPHLLVCVAVAVLFLSACSSATKVASDNRPLAIDAASATSPDDDPAPASAAAPADDDDGLTTESADSSDADDEAAPEQDAPDLEENEGIVVGGVEQLEALTGDCEIGNDLACDILFQLSKYDSAEEAVALSCGGRSDASDYFCTAGVDALPEQLVFDPESDGLDRVVTQCRDEANMTACDFLYFRSAEGSEFEELGATCGGRVVVAVPDCRTFLNP